MKAGNVSVWLAGLLSLIVLAGSTQPAASAQPPAEPSGGASTSDVTKGEILRNKGGSSYPRLVRLEHGGTANGRILASTTTYANKAGFAAVYESRDGGRTFHKLSEIHDPAGENGRGMCCSTLYELPRPVGDMPAGTLLWAGTAGVGEDESVRHNKLRLWRSDDHGKSWEFVSDIATSTPGKSVWEPEFTVSEQGDLVAFYSSGADPAHDQKIVQVRSRDGRSWSSPTDTVRHPKFEVRPGMPGVRRLPDGTYVMVYEVCNNDPVHLCGVYMRTSRNGWDFGNPSDIGTEIVSDSGKHPMHTPTIAWAPGAGPNGKLLLAYQILANGDGGIAPGNGRTLMVDETPADPASGWRTVPSPVRIKFSRGSRCRNFSPTLLPSPDGTSVLHMTTDYEYYIPGVCEAYFATGPV